MAGKLSCGRESSSGKETNKTVMRLHHRYIIYMYLIRRPRGYGLISVGVNTLYISLMVTVMPPAVSPLMSRVGS